jgi:DNA-binding NtrC family response regulator
MGTTSSSPDLKGVRALVVEDTWHIGVALQELLEHLGAEVAGPAATVSEAERLIAERPPTVAFVDVKLRNGELAYGLIDALHQRGIRVIVTSAFAVLPEKVEQIASLLPKPYTAAKVLATLRQPAS